MRMAQKFITGGHGGRKDAADADEKCLKVKWFFLWESLFNFGLFIERLWEFFGGTREN